VRGVGPWREGRGGGRRLEADPRNGGKKTDQILVLLSFFLGVEIKNYSVYYYHNFKNNL
jgi:hypothetical protein